jgi:flagellar protein FlaF
MSDYALAHKAYTQSKKSVGAPRAVEYQVFARVTRQLRAAGAGDNFPQLAAALYENQTLWSIIAADVSSDKNGLPKDLRAQLFNLYEFTRQHSRLALKREASVDALVDVNTAVMKGLRGPSPDDED